MVNATPAPLVFVSRNVPGRGAMKDATSPSPSSLHWKEEKKYMVQLQGLSGLWEFVVVWGEQKVAGDKNRATNECTIQVPKVMGRCPSIHLLSPFYTWHGTLNLPTHRAQRWGTNSGRVTSPWQDKHTWAVLWLSSTNLLFLSSLLWTFMSDCKSCCPPKATVWIFALFLIFLIIFIILSASLHKNSQKISANNLN